MNLIHIGLPKTATTTIQNTVFSDQEKYHYLGKRNNSYQSDLARDLVSQVRLCDSLSYDAPHTESLLRALSVENSEERPLLISEEALSAEGGADRREIARRLYELFSPAKVLIVLRSQTSMLKSLYLHAVKSAGETGSFDQWLEGTYGRVWLPVGSLRVGLDYDALVRAYEQLFGEENVIVLAYEGFRGRDMRSLQMLGDLVGMGADEVLNRLSSTTDNRRMSQRHRFVVAVQSRLTAGTNFAGLGRRILPFSLYQILRNIVISGRPVADPVLPGPWVECIQHRYGTGNAALASRKSLPLQMWGYPYAD